MKTIKGTSGSPILAQLKPNSTDYCIIGIHHRAISSMMKSNADTGSKKKSIK